MLSLIAHYHYIW